MTKQQRAIMTLVAAAVIYFVFFRKRKPPAVVGNVGSGQATTQIESNVLNPNFGLLVDEAGNVATGDVAAGSETP